MLMRRRVLAASNSPGWKVSGQGAEDLQPEDVVWSRMGKGGEDGGEGAANLLWTFNRNNEWSSGMFTVWLLMLINYFSTSSDDLSIEILDRILTCPFRFVY